MYQVVVPSFAGVCSTQIHLPSDMRQRQANCYSSSPMYLCTCHSSSKAPSPTSIQLTYSHPTSSPIIHRVSRCITAVSVSIHCPLQFNREYFSYFDPFLTLPSQRTWVTTHLISVDIATPLVYLRRRDHRRWP